MDDAASIDWILRAFLELDIAVAESEQPFPMPPLVPAFACETVRPSKVST